MDGENQHYVPKFLVKQFADTDGRVFCLNIETDEITKLPPKKAASDIGFNEFVIDGRKVSFEERFEKIETRTAKVIRRIVTERSLTGLRDAERQNVADFVAAQSFRTEAFRRGLTDYPDREQLGAILEQLWRSSFLVSESIERRRWALMSIEHDDVFYLGDQPVVLQNTEEPASKQALGFDIRGIEAFLPLAPTLALYMPCRSTSDQIISGRASALLLQSLTSSGREALDLAQRVLRSSEGLYEALTGGAAVVCAPENVENLNYLQCAWACSAVFSNQKSFGFAKRVLSETPQYRRVPKISLSMIGRRMRK